MRRAATMPIQSPRWPYTKTLVEQAPDEWGGVYALWAGDELLHIGHAPDCGRTLQDSLRQHLLGRCSVCAGKGTKTARRPHPQRIDVEQEQQVGYWAQRLEISPQELKRAVLKAGPMLKDVQRHLSRFSFLL